MDHPTTSLINSLPSGKNYLFAIAIDKYQQLTNSDHRVADMNKVIQTLTSQFHFSKDNIFQLFDEAATTQNIYKKFEELIGQLTVEDNVIIYFSGQGEYKEVFNQGYWTPVDAAAENVSQYIPNSEIFTILNSLPAKHILLLTDSCFSVSFFDEEEVPAEHVAQDLGSRWIVTAQRKSIVKDDQPDSDVFNKNILNYLKNVTNSFNVLDLQKNILENIPADENVEPLGGALTIAGHEGGVWTLQQKPNEEKDWTTVIRDNTIIGYQSYLTRFPEGKYREEATQRMEVLKATAANVQKEEEVWQEAIAGNSIASFLEYKKKYPEGKYSSEADGKIAMISVSGASSIPKKESETSTSPAEAKEMKVSKAVPPVPKKLGTKKFGKTEKIETKSVAPVDLKKYGKLAAMILLPIFLLFGGYQIYSSLPQEEIDVTENTSANTSSNVNDDNEINEKTLIAQDDDLDKSNEEPTAEIINEENNEVTIPEPTPEVSTTLDTEVKSPEQNQTVIEQPIDEFSEAKQFIKKADAYFKLNNWEKAKEYYERANTYNYEKDFITKQLQLCDSNIENTTSSSNSASTKVLTPIQNLERNMIRIKGGRFEMGSGDGDTDEQPVRTVTVKDFRMGKFEVTQEQYQAIMKSNPSTHQCNYCPVNNVSFVEAQDFIRKLNAQTGKRYRLPTEAEWEYAAKARDNYTYSGGNNLNGKGWHVGNSNGKTNGTGRKGRNAFGLYDMSGNVAEWCSDWYDENYYSAGNNSNPKNTSAGAAASRVIRGGSYLDSVKDCRVSNRKSMSPRSRKKGIGFRLVLD